MHIDFDFDPKIVYQKELSILRDGIMAVPNSPAYNESSYDLIERQVLDFISNGRFVSKTIEEFPSEDGISVQELFNAIEKFREKNQVVGNLSLTFETEYSYDSDPYIKVVGSYKELETRERIKELIEDLIQNHVRNNRRDRVKYDQLKFQFEGKTVDR